MKARPILMNGEMVRAVLDGRKTVTRRVIKTQPDVRPGGRWSWIICSTAKREQDKWRYSYPCAGGSSFTERGRESSDGPFACPYGQPGDELWVRETFASRVDIDGDSDPKRARHYTYYRASEDCAQGFSPSDPMNWHDFGGCWRPSIHMPRWASRITLRVEDVRVERVQEISFVDALAEGCSAHFAEQFKCGRPDCDAQDDWHYGQRWQFERLWNGINAKRGFGWDANPFVWVVTFSRVDQNQLDNAKGENQ